MDKIDQNILDGLRSWVECESPTSDAEAVNRMMTLAETDWSGIGFDVVRIPGRDGFGDHLSIKSNWGKESSLSNTGILILTSSFFIRFSSKSLLISMLIGSVLFLFLLSQADIKIKPKNIYSMFLYDKNHDYDYLEHINIKKNPFRQRDSQ